MDENDYKVGDYDNNLLRKILARLKQLVGLSSASGEVTLTVSDVQIGAVELKDADTDTRAKVRDSDPAASDNGLVVRNIPSGTQAVSGPFLTDTQLRASPLPLPSGAATEATLGAGLGAIDSELQNVTANTDNIPPLGQAVMAGSTPVVVASDQSPIPVSGPLTDTQLRATAVPVSGPLTDTQLRATPVPISGIVQSKTILTPSVPTQQTFSTASVSIVASNISRKGLAIVNVGTSRFSLSLNGPAFLDNGITLYPGDSWEIDEYCFSTAEVFAIGAAVGGIASIQEFTT